MTCMAFLFMIESYLDNNNLGANMINCIICNSEFYARHAAKACSLKCKVLAGIKKEENGCWIYKKSSSGAYGKIRWQMQWYSAHRVSYEEFVGPITKGLLVCHKCDTPKCVNPDHLFLGSHKDNRKDAVDKNRVPKGEVNHFSKFTDKQIKEMRLLKEEGFTYQRLSNIFNCSFSYLCSIIKNYNRS